MEVIKLDRNELKQMIVEAIKRVQREELSPTEVFAGLIWHYCINSRDHYYKGEYYDLPVSFRYDNDGVCLMDVNYLQQDNQWSLISPDYKHILRIAPLVLKWMDDTYFAYVAAQQQASVPKSPRRRRRRGMRRSNPRPRPRRRAIAQSSILGSPLSQSQLPRQERNTKPRTRYDPGENQADLQDEKLPEITTNSLQ